MPFRPVQRPPDLARVARILGSEPRRDMPAGEPGGWVPAAPRAQPVEVSGATTSAVASGVPGESPVAFAVRRLTQPATEDDEVSRLDADLRRARRPGVLTVPDELRTGRRVVSSAAVVALLALVVAVGCAFVLRVLWAERSAAGSDLAPGPVRSVQVVGGTAGATGTARREGDASIASASGRAAPASALSATAPAAPAAPAGSAPAGSAAGGSAAGGELVVHVVGQVGRPGLVRLRAGARVADAIAAAGGTRPGADVTALNLARAVADGEQIRVPKPGEVPVAAAGASAPGGTGVGAGGAPGGSGAPVSLNTADTTALDTLPGVGPVLAQRILDWRTEHGRFTSVDELGEVSGIGDKLMAQLRPKVTL